MPLHFPNSDEAELVGRDSAGLFIFEVRSNSGFDESMRPELLTVRLGATDDWEFAAVMTSHRCATWDEMCDVVDLIWDDEDCVFQLHPPGSEYVNCHPYTLWLWRPLKAEIPRPPFGPNSPLNRPEMKDAAAFSRS